MTSRELRSHCGRSFMLTTKLSMQVSMRDLSILAKSPPKEAKGSVSRHTRWIPSMEACVKLNVDAALAKTHPGGAVSMVCCDVNGLFLGASSLTI
jgi:hypothetical protein